MGAIRSEQFDDIYFSPEDGLAETSHVFLGGNDLPVRWRGRNHFTIVETGFGTGLNFLAAWSLFAQSAQDGQVLDYISFEKYPLSAGQITQALAGWAGRFGGRLETLIKSYPLRVPGFHRVLFEGGRVRLTIVFDDVNEALPELVAPGGADAWFLDGFAPSKNPDMWSETLFSGMARLSRPGATFATFTVAGVVRRGLAEAGFTVEKAPGFGRKKEMLRGRFAGTGAALNAPSGPGGKVAVIGGGLMGTACAYALRLNGVTPVIYEASSSLASGGSGNLIAMVNPRLAALRSPVSDFYTAGFAQAVRTLPDLPKDICWRSCGSVQLANDDERRRKLEGAYKNWGWHEDHIKWLDAEAASRQAGVPGLDCEALFFPDCGAVSPAALCQAYDDGAEARCGAAVSDVIQDGKGWRIGDEIYDAVILACGAAVKNFAGLEWLPLRPVRGQVTLAQENERTRNLKTNLCYGGYITPARAGLHAVGATFGRDDERTDIRDADNRANLADLLSAVPALGDTLNVCGARAGVRSASRDHVPVIGAVPEHDDGMAGGQARRQGLYLCAAPGPFGVVTSIAASHLLADKITGRPYSLPLPVCDAIDPARFLARARRKGLSS